MKNYDYLTQTALRISGAHPEKCMKCGKCSGACPNYDAMEFHPHQMADMVLRGEIEKIMDSPSTMLCVGCMVCSERCPRGVAPSRLIDAARTLGFRRQSTQGMSPTKISEFADEDTPQQLLMAAMRKYHR